ERTVLNIIYTINWLFIFWISISQVTQAPMYQDLQEGDRVTITCKSNDEYSYFHWYRQGPRMPLSYLLSITSSQNVTKEGLTAEYLDTGQRSCLHLSSSLLQDSGTYFCGVIAQQFRKSETHNQNLTDSEA
uniref:Ig-like domain-containing protein n=1 Tax=Pseudonaja textilis TaxID=8673 RepID=A0A670YT27_PSETE